MTSTVRYMYGRVPGFACFSCSSFHWLPEFECIRSPFCSFGWFIKSYFTKIVEIWSKCHYIVRDVSSEVYTSSLCVTDVDLSIMVCGIIDGDPGIRMCGSTWVLWCVVALMQTWVSGRVISHMGTWVSRCVVSLMGT